jgi:hypothetical protein
MSTLSLARVLLHVSRHNGRTDVIFCKPRTSFANRSSMDLIPTSICWHSNVMYALARFHVFLHLYL